MKIKITVMAGLVLAGALGSTATGDAHVDKAVMAAIKARQATMTLYAFNISLLGEMAKGKIEYDAAAAGAAAASLAKLTTTDQSRMWPMGSDNETLGDATAALPAIWQSGSKAGAIGGDLAKAAAALDGAAGQGLDVLRGAIGPVGKACKACHKDYRKSES